jgi:DNA-binding transcriptional LysR family regulator
MQLEALKVFCDLAGLRSFSKAAEVNNLSQPTVTRLVHQLEERLGGLLIDRSKRPLQLTALGQAYYTGCKRLLEEYIELEASLRRDHAGMALIVRIAAIYSVGLWDMGQYVERFEELYPHARVRIDYLHPKQVYERVLEGEAEFGLVSYPAGTRELDVLPRVALARRAHGYGLRAATSPGGAADAPARTARGAKIRRLRA